MAKKSILYDMPAFEVAKDPLPYSFEEAITGVDPGPLSWDDPIPTPITTTASDYFSNNYDSISSYAKYAKQKVEPLYDPDEEEEEREDDERPRSRFNYVPPSMRTRPEGIEDLTNYISTRSFSSLLKYLVKSGILHESSNAIGFDPTSMNLEDLRAHQSRQILSLSKAYTSTIITNIPKGIISFDTKACNLDVIALMEEVYLLPHYKKIFFILDSRDTLNQIIRESALRGIGIESKIKDNRFDFDSLRLNSTLLKLAYFGNINELFLVYDSYTTMYSNLPIYNSFENIPVIKREVEEYTLNETVSINGKNYSKKMIESMIECNFDTFIENLEVEKYISSLESVEKESLVSIQDIKLI